MRGLIVLLVLAGVILLLPGLAVSSMSSAGIVELYGLRWEGTWPWLMASGLVMLAFAALVSLLRLRR